MNGKHERRKNSRSAGRGKTLDLKKAHYSTDLIREYEDPEFAEEAYRYEQEKRKKQGETYRDFQGRSRKPHPDRRREPGGFEQAYEEKRARQEEYNRSLYNDAGGFGGGSGGRYGSGFDSDAEERRYRREDNWYQEKEPVLEQERRRKESRKRAYRFRPGIFLRNILILLLILCAAAGCIFFALTSGLKTTDLDRSSLAIPEEAKSSLSDYQNIVILGSDARAGESYKGSRTDAIMILSINKKTGKAKMISVMRDSYLRFSGSNGQNVYEKVTHAFAYGGAENTLSALNRAMDLNISQYVLFNWKAVTDAVDSLGGVEIDVKADEVDDLNRNGDDTAKNVGGTYTPVTGAGNMLMDGVQATTYCRIRETSGGDVARGNRTKIVFEAILSKAMKNPLKLKSMMDTVLPELQTNFTKAELFKLALSSRKMDITENLSWPKSYYGGIVDGMWVAVPATLRENVIWLHKEAFGDSDYVPSDACTSLSESIIEESGHRTANN